MDDLHRRCERREKVILELVGKFHPDKDQLTFELNNNKNNEIGANGGSDNDDASSPYSKAASNGCKIGTFNG